MARRRKSNRRRRGSFGFLYKLLSVLVICGAIVAALTLFFRVDTVVISTQHNPDVPLEQIRRDMIEQVAKWSSRRRCWMRIPSTMSIPPAGSSRAVPLLTRA